MTAAEGTPLSCYIMTHNSERRLREVLAALQGLADDVVLVDSGSTDATQAIAEGFGARFVSRPLRDFADQRRFAAAQCRHDWVLSVDSDEVVSPALDAELGRLLRDGLDPDATDAYAIRRDWYVLGQRVRCFYPSLCPDYPIRLFHRGHARYSADRRVHENMAGFRHAERIDAPLLHYTADTVDQLYSKVNLYTSLAAEDLRQGGRPSRLAVTFQPWLVWFKWYVVTGAWRDGAVGAITARYAADMAYQKYVKARYDSAA